MKTYFECSDVRYVLPQGPIKGHLFLWYSLSNCSVTSTNKFVHLLFMQTNSTVLINRTACTLYKKTNGSKEKEKNI